MKVREESTSRPGKKNPKHQDGAAAAPACRQLPQAERKPEYRPTRVLQERKHSIQREGGGRQLGSGEGCITCFEDKLWLEDFCGYRVDFFLSPCARIERKSFYLSLRPFAISDLNRPVPSSTAVH